MRKQKLIHSFRQQDANGNLISDGQYYREYDGLNQLVRVRLGNTSTAPVLEEYRWHPVEERIIQKKVFYNGVLNYTVYYPNENFVQIVNSSGTFTEKYIYQNGVLVAQINSDGQKQFIHSDNKGSNTLITALDGSVVENTFYSPYGEIISGGKNSRYGYEGKEYDSLMDDVDFKFRKYEPDIIIYDKPDTLIQEPYNPQDLNRYAFERNNPYKYTDPTGHKAKATIDEKKKTITIEATIYTYGKGSSAKKAKKIEDKINKAWSDQTFKVGDKEYKVISKIKVSHLKERPDFKNLGKYENAIEIKTFFSSLFHRSFVKERQFGDWTGSFSFAQQNKGVYEHEAGHLFGLRDRYTDAGGPMEGYKNTLMAGGSVRATQSDIDNMLSQSYTEHTDKYREVGSFDVGKVKIDVVVNPTTEHLLDYEDDDR